MKIIVSVNSELVDNKINSKGRNSQQTEIYIKTVEKDSVVFVNILEKTWQITSNKFLWLLRTSTP